MISSIYVLCGMLLAWTCIHIVLIILYPYHSPTGATGPHAFTGNVLLVMTESMVMILAITMHVFTTRVRLNIFGMLLTAILAFLTFLFNLLATMDGGKQQVLRVISTIYVAATSLVAFVLLAYAMLRVCRYICSSETEPSALPSSAYTLSPSSSSLSSIGITVA
jgi:hypothetical protein